MFWWAVQDLNLRPLACEANALATELTAQDVGGDHVDEDKSARGPLVTPRAIALLPE
jgi:hypothetical protein